MFKEYLLQPQPKGSRWNVISSTVMAELSPGSAVMQFHGYVAHMAGPGATHLGICVPGEVEGCDCILIVSKVLDAKEDAREEVDAEGSYENEPHDLEAGGSEEDHSVVLQHPG